MHKLTQEQIKHFLTYIHTLFFSLLGQSSAVTEELLDEIKPQYALRIAGTKKNLLGAEVVKSNQ